MTIEELKALPEDWCQGLESCQAADALMALRPEILALVEAAQSDFKDRDGWMTERSRIDLHAFNAKLASL